MKIAIITDQHFGARKNSKLFHDYSTAVRVSTFRLYPGQRITITIN